MTNITSGNNYTSSN